jgi:hypothetical protein
MERPDPSGDLDAEGIPDLEDPPPGLQDTGGDYEALTPPRDYPLAADEYGTTAREQRIEEPLDVRRRREVPDRIPRYSDEPEVGRLIADDEQDGRLDAEGTDDTVGLSAEESAIHVIPE